MYAALLSLVLVFAGGALSAQIDCRTADLATRLLSLQLDLVGDPGASESYLGRMATVLDSRPIPIGPGVTDPDADADARTIASLVRLSFKAISSDGTPDTLTPLLQSDEARLVRRSATLAILRAACATSIGERTTTDTTLELGITAPSYARTTEGDPTGPPGSVIERYLPDVVTRIAFGSIAMLLSGGVVARQLFLLNISRKRRRRRYRVNQPLAFRANGIEMSGRLLDVNCYGVKLQHDGGLPDRAVAEILFLQKWRPIRVVWRNSHYAGATFVEPLHLAELLVVVTGSRRARTRSSLRPA